MQQPNGIPPQPTTRGHRGDDPAVHVAHAAARDARPRHVRRPRRPRQWRRRRRAQRCRPLDRVGHPRLPRTRRDPSRRADDVRRVRGVERGATALLGAQLHRLAALQRGRAQRGPPRRHRPAARRATSGRSSPRTSTACTRRRARRDVIELHGSLDRAVCLTCGEYTSRIGLHERMTEANPGFMERFAEAAHAVGSQWGEQVRPDGDIVLADALVESFHAAALPRLRQRHRQARRRLLRRVGAQGPRRAVLLDRRGGRRGARARVVAVGHERLPLRPSRAPARRAGRDRHAVGDARRRRGDRCACTRPSARR